MTGAVVEARDLTFAYHSGAPAIVTSFDHSFAPRAVTAVTGVSGSGKSTMLYLLALMLRATSGTVLWYGRPMAAIADGELSRIRARHVGFVFQDAMLDASRTIVDNVAEAGLFAGMPRGQARERALGLLKQFGVAHRVDHRPGEISGGQAQRVALCRALLTDPIVVLADEPTGNLDTTSAQVVWQALCEHAHARGATVVIATHDEKLVAAADHRLVLT